MAFCLGQGGYLAFPGEVFGSGGIGLIAQKVELARARGSATRSWEKLNFDDG
jgi:hypothetical protein